MKKIIIGICGFAGSGKSTVADILEKNHGFKKLSFAGPLKDMVSSIFGWDREMLEGTTQESRQWREKVDPWWSDRLQYANLTPRLILQIMGTEVMRAHYHSDIWIASMEKQLLDNNHNRLVITDCRFPNEFKAISDQGGDILYISRELTNPSWFAAYKEPNMAPPKNVHISETAWINEPIDHVIINDLSISDLKRSINELVLKLEK